MSIMKAKLVLSAAIALLLSHSVFAQVIRVCERGTLASYIALGAGGCEFNGALYNNFTYSSPSTATVNPANIIVLPLTAAVAGFYPGLNFSAPWSVGAGQSQQSVIGYEVVPFPPITSATAGVLTLDLGQATVSGIIGSVTVQENTVSTSGTISIVDTLEVYDKCADACTIKQTDSVTVSPLQTIQTSLIVTLSGGTGGASLKSFAADDTFGPLT
jgi:hypothetical protein